MAALHSTKKAAPGIRGRLVFVDATVVLLCCAIRSFLVHPSFDVFPCPVPTTLLVSGYLRRNATEKFRVPLSRPPVHPFRFRSTSFPAFRLPRPPPPYLAEARTSFSRAVVNKRTCWRVEAFASGSNLCGLARMSTLSDVSIFERGSCNEEPECCIYTLK